VWSVTVGRGDGREDVIRALRRPALLSAIAVAGLFAASAVATAGPSIRDKRNEAQRVEAQLQQLDAAAQRAQSQYQSATHRLAQLQRALRLNRQAMGVAHVNLRKAQRTLERRLFAIYTSREDQASLAVILGAHSLDDLISRIETVNSVSSQDSAIIGQVLSFQRQIVHRQAFLNHARNEQRHLVAVRAASVHGVQSRLAAAQNLYASVKSQIQHLVSAQQAQQVQARQQATAALQTQVALGQTGSVSGLPDTSLPGDKYASAVGIAMQYLGVKYVWGGATPAGFDCSGLVMYVFAQLGVSLPHYTVAQYDYPNSVSVPRDQLEPGDLVFFNGLGHVGIYIGNGEFIHAPHTGAVVSIDSLNGWYASTYSGAKRILG
jgi:cell wall-associated NlpC family hydrolase